MAGDEQGALPVDQAERRARAIVVDALREYADQRVESYNALALGRLLGKDVLMFAMRGVQTAPEFVEAALAAFESSSEETHMGGVVQRIAVDLSSKAIDLSDVVIERDGDLWVIEVKSQTNTVTGTFRNDLLTKMKARVDEYSRPRAARRRQVRAMLAVIRGKAQDREVTCKFGPGDTYAALNGFVYTYKVGRPFWEWLTGHPGIGSLLDEVPPDAHRVVEARDRCLKRLQAEMESALAAEGADRSIRAVMRLADERNG